MKKPKDPQENWVTRCIIYFEVLKRSPKYLQEWEVSFQNYLKTINPSKVAKLKHSTLLLRFYDSPEGKELAKRWGLNLAFSPNDERWTNIENDLIPILVGRARILAVEVIKHADGIFWKNKEKLEPDWVPHLKEARYLTLEIDLHSSQSEILSFIKTYLKLYQSSIGRTKVRSLSLDIYLDEKPPGGPVTIFAIWDANKKEGKKAWQIAQELHPELKGLSYQDKARNYDSNARRLHQQVTDAIGRVDRLIATTLPINP